MKEMILVFGPASSGKRKALTRALAPAKLKLTTVAEEDCDQPIGVIAGMTEAEVEEFSAEGYAPTGRETELDEPFMVFANLSQQRLDEALRRIRQANIVVPNKAILTPSNAAWKPAQLLAELKAEREAIAQGLPPESVHS